MIYKQVEKMVFYWLYNRLLQNLLAQNNNPHQSSMVAVGQEFESSMALGSSS